MTGRDAAERLAARDGILAGTNSRDGQNELQVDAAMARR
jgi:hypothetical protein